MQKKKKTDKNYMPDVSVSAGIIYVGRILAPIFLWLSVFSILKAYIKRSSWSFETRIALYLVLAFACLLFLLVAHVFSEEDFGHNKHTPSRYNA